MKSYSMLAASALLTVNLSHAAAQVELPVSNQIINPGQEYKLEVGNLMGYIYDIDCKITTEIDGHVVNVVAMVTADPQMPSGARPADMKLNGKSVFGNFSLMSGSNTLSFIEANVTAPSPSIKFKNFDNEKTLTVESCVAGPHLYTHTH